MAAGGRDTCRCMCLPTQAQPNPISSTTLGYDNPRTLLAYHVENGRALVRLTRGISADTCLAVTMTSRLSTVLPQSAARTVIGSTTTNTTRARHCDLGRLVGSVEVPFTSTRAGRGV